MSNLSDTSFPAESFQNVEKLLATFWTGQRWEKANLKKLKNPPKIDFYKKFKNSNTKN